jgi:hypothetical protein
MPIQADIGNLSGGMYESEPGSLGTFDALGRIGMCKPARYWVSQLNLKLFAAGCLYIFTIGAGGRLIML